MCSLANDYQKHCLALLDKPYSKKHWQSSKKWKVSQEVRNKGTKTAMNAEVVNEIETWRTANIVKLYTEW